MSYGLYEIPTAAQAQKDSQKGLDSSRTQKRIEICQKIEQATNIGATTISFTTPVDDIVLFNMLVSLGYHVEFKEDILGKEYIWTLSWSDEEC